MSKLTKLCNTYTMDLLTEKHRVILATLFYWWGGETPPNDRFPSENEKLCWQKYSGVMFPSVESVINEWFSRTDDSYVAPSCPDHSFLILPKDLRIRWAWVDSDGLIPSEEIFAEYGIQIDGYDSY